MQGFWASCLSRFEKELPAQQFNTWIRPLKLDASAAPSGELRLLAPNRFVLQWVKERFVTRIEAMGAEFFSSPIRVSLTLEAASAPEPVEKTSAPAIRAARAARGALEPHSRIQLRWLCRRKSQSARARRRTAGRRTSRHIVQPAVHLRRRGLGKDPPDSRSRQPCSRAASECARAIPPRRAVHFRCHQSLSTEVFR